jgi:hypothetical protein
MFGIISLREYKHNLNNTVNLNESDKKMLNEFKRLKFSKLLNFFDKHEFKILALITVILGLYFVISNLIELGNFNHLTSFYLFFTFLIVTLLFDINYLIIFKKK